MTKTPTDHLRRIADANQTPAKGLGLSDSHLMPLCAIFDPTLAERLRRRFENASIVFQFKRSRLTNDFFVSKECWNTANEIWQELQQEYPDNRPKTYSRDFESAIVVAFATGLIAFVCFMKEEGSGLTWLRVVLSGAIACVGVEWVHRRCRWRLSQVSIFDLLLVVTVAAIVLAIWRW